MHPCWTELPDAVFRAHMLPRLSIDLRRALGYRPARLKVDDAFVQKMDRLLNQRKSSVKSMCQGTVIVDIPMPYDEDHNIKPVLKITYYFWDEMYLNSRYGTGNIYIDVAKVVPRSSPWYRPVVSVYIPPLSISISISNSNSNAPRPQACPEFQWAIGMI